MSEPSQELVVPGLGTVVDLTDVREASLALDDVRDLERMLRYVKQELVEAIVAESRKQGTKTLHLEGATVTVKTGEEWVYDAEEVEQGLRAAGMPEERIREIVKETVSYKVDAVKAKQAASANALYAEVVEAHKELQQKPPSVSISRTR